MQNRPKSKNTTIKETNPISQHIVNKSIKSVKNKNDNIDLSSCSSDHINDDYLDIDYTSILEDKIITNLNLDKIYKTNIDDKHKPIYIEEKNFKKEGSTSLWMLFYRRLFKSFLGSKKAQLTELNELLFRINFILNQKTDQNLQPFNPPSKFNIVNTYNQIKDELKSTKNENSNNTSTINCLKYGNKYNLNLKDNKRNNTTRSNLKKASTIKRTNLNINRNYLTERSNLQSRAASNINSTNNLNLSPSFNKTGNGRFQKMNTNNTYNSSVSNNKTVGKNALNSLNNSINKEPRKNSNNFNENKTRISKKSVDNKIRNLGLKNYYEPILSNYYLNLNLNKKISKNKSIYFKILIN